MSAEFYIGRRLCYDGLLCTVRYYGHLSGTKGEWLGVEWDDISRGKHGGQHQDQQIFHCQSTSSTAASFIRPSRKRDGERTVLEAIRYKYSSSVADGTSSDHELVVISGKVAEEVGFEKIAQEQARLADLRIVLVDQLVVNGVASRGASGNVVRQAQQELLETCPNIVELEIGWNTIETWQDVADICSALPKLRVLRAGGLRFRDLALGNDTNSLRNLRELHLDDCLLDADSIASILNNMGESQNLEKLVLTGNELDSFAVSSNFPALHLERLKSLNLDRNNFRDLGCVLNICSIFPNLRDLSLQANQISEIGHKFLRSTQPLSKIETLNLADNEVESYIFVDQISEMFPSLSSLQMTGNPVFLQTDSNTEENNRASEKSYYLTLARIPRLKLLNYTKIDAKDRQEGELYYLSVAEGELKSTYVPGMTVDTLRKTIERLHPRYDPLIEKYARPSVIEKLSLVGGVNGIEGESGISDTSALTYPPGSLGSRLVKANFYIPESKVSSERPNTSSQSIAEVKLELPSSLPVKQVMAILLRQAMLQDHLQPLHFDMILESKELDPVDTTAESSTRSTMYTRNLTTEERRTYWRQWGEWDADAMVEGIADNIIDEKFSGGTPGQVTWTAEGICFKDGRQWKRREVNIPHSLKRAWGDWLENSKEVTIRIVPYEDSI